jgi:hypothetical protein
MAELIAAAAFQSGPGKMNFAPKSAWKLLQANSDSGRFLPHWAYKVMFARSKRSRYDPCVRKRSWLQFSGPSERNELLKPNEVCQLTASKQRSMVHPHLDSSPKSPNSFPKPVPNIPKVNMK